MEPAGYGARKLRRPEYVVAANPPPHDVRLPGRDFRTELPGGTTVRGECHFHDVRRALNGLDPEPRSKGSTGFQVLDESCDGRPKSSPRGQVQVGPVTVETRQPLIGRHLLERVQERIGIVEDGTLAIR